MRFSASVVAVLGAGVLAGCLPFLGQKPPAPDVYLLRNPTVTMSATSRFDAARFSGRWVLRGGFDTALRIAAFRFTAAQGVGAWQELRRVEQANAAFDGFLKVDQPGVFTVTFRDGTVRQMVVLWVDDGFRTAALATRDGRYGAVFDRHAKGGKDRIEAARILLRTNGFDVSKLRMIGE